MTQDAMESPVAAAVRVKLVQLVASHGSMILDDARRVRAMLSDAVSGATAESNLVGLAVSSGVPGRLSAVARDPRAVADTVDSAVHDLERTSSVQHSDAVWVVGALAEALGIDRGSGTPGGANPAPSGPAGADDLIVRAAGRETVARPGTSVTVGRGPDSTVVLDSAAVSRQHARIDHRNGAWEYTDLQSTQGSFVNGVAVRTVPVGPGLRVAIGQGADSVALELVAAGATRQRPADGPLRPSPATALPGAAHPDLLRPGGAHALGLDGRQLLTAVTLAANVGAAPTELGRGTADSVTVTLDGQSRTIYPGTTLTIGREPGNDLVATETTVSRRHAEVDDSAGAWHLRDLGTTSGTWLDGRRIAAVPLRGEQQFRLGDPVTGAALAVRASGPGVGRPGGGDAPRRTALSGRRPLIAAVAASAVVVLVAGLLFWTLGGGGDSKPSNDQLARATVHLTAGDFTGSGVVIDRKKGLILTNAHVAAPRAVGMGASQWLFADEQDPDPKDIIVGVSDGLEHSAEPRFEAHVVVADGYLDVAVIKIDRKLSGSEVDASDLADLTQVSIGNSDTIMTSDAVSYIGYPGAAQSERPTYTTGVISSAVKDVRLGTNRAAFNSTAIISGGNSGGLAVDSHGKMIGIPTWARLDNKQNPVFSSFRPINLVKPVMDAAEHDKAYTSPWSSVGPTGAKLSNLRIGTAGKPGGVSDGCTEGSGGSGPLAISLDYVGFTGGKHTDLLVGLYSDPDSPPQKVVALANTTGDDAYPTALPASGCLTATFDDVVPNGRYELKVGVGGDLRVALDTTVTRS